MLLDLLLFAIAGLVGLRLQRRADSDALRARLWQANLVVLIPLAAAFAFLTLELDRQLVAVIACGVAAWWLTVLASGGLAALLAPDRASRGALWLVGAFPNTGFIGFPLAHLAYGQEGLRLAVVYDQVSLVVPAVVVGAIIAARHAGEGVEGPSVARALLTSVPLWTVAVLVALRLTIVPEPVEAAALGTFVGHVVGPIGFLLLGLSLPLGGFVHDRREVVATAAAVLVRVAAAPLLLVLTARATGTDIPDALYYIAGMPTAFHALVISRVHGLQPAVVRLAVLASTVLVVGGTVVAVATGAVPGG